MSAQSRLLISSSIQGILCFALPAYVTVRRFNRQPLRFLGLTTPVSWRPFAGVVIVFIIGLPMLNWLVAVNESITLPVGLGGLEGKLREWEDAARAMTSEMLAASSFNGLLINILVIGLLTGLCEELFFRGALQRIMGNIPQIAKGGAVWCAAIIFSAVHFQFFGFIPRMLLGLFFGYILYSTGSLWPSIFAHMLNNSLVVITTWFEGHGNLLGVLQTVGIPSEGRFPWLAMSSALTLAVFLECSYNWFFSKKELKNG
ncbi:MAG: CPBP family intramembrane metalloprotease [Muribaculaceae bacterium]|nr:CPBP family intramembrane metalloprotease [Muribaculaceae bacterium]